MNAAGADLHDPASGRRLVQFLDTSHQIDRAAGPFRVRFRRAQEVSRDAMVVTSSIVLMEYKRSVLADLEVLRELLDDIARDGRDPKVFLGALRDMLQTQRDRPTLAYSHRRVYRISQWIDRLEELLDGYAIPVRVTVMQIACRSLLERAEEDFYTVVYGPGDERNLRDEPAWWFDGTRCRLAFPTVVALDILDNRTPECQNDRADCELGTFLLHSAPRLKALLADVQARQSKPADIKEPLWKGLRALGSFLELRADRRPGKRLCWSINDLLIALETPDGACLLATDRDFDYLFDQLGHASRCPGVVPASQILPAPPG